jgi:poly-beta-1,6-N-acetyl-D-glucosamine synthase
MGRRNDLTIRSIIRHRYMSSPLKYVLITPARNEADFIEMTLKSVISQTVRPERWVIVNDGSTDNTAEIVARYTIANPWIELVELPERRDRNFAGKAYAVSVGCSRLGILQYDVIGNLDADVSFEPDYFEFLIGRFAGNTKLGCAGTAFYEKGISYNYEFVGIEHVSGMCQMFRRECFEEIGGYAAIRSGGIDLIAVLSARAKGWDTRTFPEKKFEHHRNQGGALHTGFRERIYTGRKDYLLGNHPLWELSRSFYQMKRKPYIVGGLLVLGSYMWNWVRVVERTMPEELMALRRDDQMKRLKVIFQRRLPMHGSTT